MVGSLGLIAILNSFLKYDNLLNRIWWKVVRFPPDHRMEYELWNMIHFRQLLFFPALAACVTVHKSGLALPG
jgi:hypothetical protein